jgi:hypothetical protein
LPCDYFGSAIDEAVNLESPGAILLRPDRPDLVISASYLIAHFKFTRFELADVENVATERLHIGDFEFSNFAVRCAVDYDAACVILLATSFGIEISAIEDDSKRGVLWNRNSRIGEALLVEDSFDVCADVAKVWSAGNL